MSDVYWRVIIGNGQKVVSICGGDIEGDLSTGRVISNTCVFRGNGPAIAGLFIIQRPLFHIMVLKCMSLYAT